MNFFTVNNDGLLTYTNINDARLSEHIQPGRNLWGEYADDSAVPFVQACLQALHDRTYIMLETNYIPEEIRWRMHIYPTEGGLAIYCINISRESQTQADEQPVSIPPLTGLRWISNLQFVVYTLNSIQHYIIRKDVESAVHYLASFSRLIRGVLTDTESGKIRLADELEMIRLYLQLEQIHTDDAFTWHIYFSSQLNSYRWIPAWIILPLLAHKTMASHGRPNNGKAMLNITIIENQDYISIKIDDSRSAPEPEIYQAIPAALMDRMQAEGVSLQQEAGSILTLYIPSQPETKEI